MQIFRFALLLLALATAPALAAESTPHVSPRAIVTLVSDTDAVAPGQSYHLGLRFQLADGWHTYGRNPGDAGIPPDLTWTLPPGSTVGDIVWPTPQRQPEGPLMTYGYTGDAMLVLPAAGPGPIHLQASFLICKNICVPENAVLSLDLPAGQAAPSAQSALFAEAATHQARPSPFTAVISPDARLVLSGVSPSAVTDAWFMPDEPDQIAPSAPQTLTRAADRLTLALQPVDGFRTDHPLSGILVLRDQTGQESALAITAQPGEVEAALPLWQLLGFALLGGLILNAMPCVFPVLAMKAMAIARLSSEARSVARAHAAGYSVGVMASFAGIGAAVIGLRALGHQIGWGFQFQSPLFVAVVAWVLFAVGLNLSGVFNFSSRLASAGQSLTLRSGFIGSFFSGALAVLVATPCTAPFMSVALAAGLAAPAWQTLLIFLALGAGLAAPIVALEMLPGVAALLPRPGKWMEIFKRLLALPMYGATFWLAWVISLQAGAEGVLVLAAGVVLVGLAAWIFQRGRPLTAGICLLLLATLLAPLAQAPEAALAQAELGGEKFSTTRLAELRHAGQPVFVNMTAAWCVTCLVNERVALHPAFVRAAFARQGVVWLTGDWTRQDPEISAFLRDQGRDGVPLYLYYPPDGKPAVELPQILTPSLVLGAIGA